MGKNALTRPAGNFSSPIEPDDKQRVETLFFLCYVYVPARNKTSADLDGVKIAIYRKRKHQFKLYVQ